MFTRTTILAVGIGLALWQAVPASAAPVRPDKKQKEIAGLVERLGLRDAVAVEEAVKRLTHIGPAALPELREAAQGRNPEVAKRAKGILDQIKAGALKKMTDFLAKHNAEDGAVVAGVQEPALERNFPTYLFVSVVYRQYPVGRIPPEPLKVHNIFIVGPDDKLQQITDVKGLTRFFQDALRPLKDDADFKDAARGWLALGVNYHQDGFFRFSIPKDAAVVVREGKGHKVTAKAEVAKQGGNSGGVKVAMTFGGDGQLRTVVHDANLRAGIRPICQATKLLDADPIVRAMAEKDILVMGRAARAYLHEQRKKAAPALQRAIDRVWKRIVDEGW
jgi:hypothetical protein